MRVSKEKIVEALAANPAGLNQKVDAMLQGYDECEGAVSRDLVALMAIFETVAALEIPVAAMSEDMPCGQLTVEQKAAGIDGIPCAELIDTSIELYTRIFNGKALPSGTTELEQLFMNHAVKQVGMYYAHTFAQAHNEVARDGLFIDMGAMNNIAYRFAKELDKKGVKGFEFAPA